MQNVEDEQPEIKSACIEYFLQFFKAMDEDAKGVLVGDAFKTVIGKLEEDMPMEAKEVTLPTPFLHLLAPAELRSICDMTLGHDTWRWRAGSMDDTTGSKANRGGRREWDH